MSYTKKIYNFLNKDANVSQDGLNATRISLNVTKTSAVLLEHKGITLDTVGKLKIYERKLFTTNFIK